MNYGYAEDRVRIVISSPCFPLAMPHLRRIETWRSEVLMLPYERRTWHVAARPMEETAADDAQHYSVRIQVILYHTHARSHP